MEELRKEEIKKQKWYISKNCVYMTTRKTKNTKEDEIIKGDITKIFDDISQDYVLIGIKYLIHLIKSNYKEFENVLIEKQDNNLYFYFDDDIRRITYKIPILYQEQNLIKDGTKAKYNIEMLHEFIKEIPKNTTKEHKEIPIYFKDKGLLCLDYGNEDILIISPIIDY